eukprot:8511501-Pyramimonas_sp.AAC.1
MNFLKSPHGVQLGRIRAVLGSCGAVLQALAAFLGCSGLRVSRPGFLLRPSSGRRGGAWFRRGSRGPPRPSWTHPAVFAGCPGALLGPSCAAFW